MNYDIRSKMPRVLAVSILLTAFCRPARAAQPPAPQAVKSEQTTFIRCGVSDASSISTP
jgi:hypothetical protein